MFPSVARLAVKVRGRLRRDGAGTVLLHGYEIAVLGAASLLLAPFRRRAADEPFYSVFEHFLSAVAALGCADVLEVGSRNVSGIMRRDLIGNGANYTGFDIHAGGNVDVVGDAHAISAHFDFGRFDAVFSISVFEHLAMPWKALLEINRVMKPGGLLYISSHPVWPAHELPWDFWRFSAETFRVLLNHSTGFEIVECVEGNPARIVSLSRDPATRGAVLSRVNQSVAVLARKTGEPDPRIHWDVAAGTLLDTMYPVKVESASRGD